MDLAGAEQKVITGLTVETAISGMPVRARICEVGRVNQRCVGVGSQQDRPLLGREPTGRR
jgi:hypothetical protein